MAEAVACMNETGQVDSTAMPKPEQLIHSAVAF
jgi:hypothetical protein